MQYKNYYFTTTQWLIVTSVFLLLIPMFWDGLAELVERWGKQEEYSHGYLIPLLTLYFIWEKRSYLQTLEFRPSYLAVPFVIVALLIASVGEISAIYLLIHYAFILILMGMVLALGGWKLLRALLFPLAILVFSVPLPYFLEATLTADLQLISSSLGVAFIRLMSIPVFAEGNVISLSNYQLQVVEACSGLNYMYPLLSIAFILGYMYQAAMWKRAIIFISAIPITILMNSFRIGVIGVLVEYWGSSMAEGFLHFFEGWIIFIACMALILAEIKLFEVLSRSGKSMAQVLLFPEARGHAKDIKPENAPRKIGTPFLILSAIILVGIAALTLLDDRPEKIPSRQSFTGFPLFHEGWKGSPDGLSEIVQDKLSLTDYALISYKSETGKMVDFYSAYYESQRKGVSPHSPRVCIPGGGWSITGINRVEVDVGDGLKVPVNRIYVQNGELKMLVYYWFYQRGRNLASEYLLKWFLLKDSVQDLRSDGALMRLTTLIEGSEQEADENLQKFLKDFYPEFKNYIPE